MPTNISILGKSYSRCLGFLVALVIIFSSLSPYFFSFKNFDNIFSATTVIGLLALASTFVLASGGIDLSIASVMALSGTTAATLLKTGLFSETPLLQAITYFSTCVICGACCGALTGVLINITRAPSFIVSLGMLSIYRGVAYIVTGGGPIFSLPKIVTTIGQGKVMEFSAPVLLFFVLTLLCFILLHTTKFGIHLLAYGDKPTAAIAMGINASRLRLTVFTITGILAGIAGFIFTARTNVGDPAAGQGYELIAITAAVLGGAKLFGGRAHILGTLLGVICLGTLQNGLNLLAVSTYYQMLFVGAVLISASLLERVGGKR